MIPGGENFFLQCVYEIVICNNRLKWHPYTAIKTNYIGFYESDKCTSNLLYGNKADIRGSDMKYWNWPNKITFIEEFSKRISDECVYYFLTRHV